MPRTAIRLTLWLCFCLDEFWFSDGSLSDKSKCADPGLMPLPDTATGLDWSHLVDAARAFEGKNLQPPGPGASAWETWLYLGLSELWFWIPDTSLWMKTSRGRLELSIRTFP